MADETKDERPTPEGAEESGAQEGASEETSASAEGSGAKPEGGGDEVKAPSEEAGTEETGTEETGTEEAGREETGTEETSEPRAEEKAADASEEARAAGEGGAPAEGKEEAGKEAAAKEAEDEAAAKAKAEAEAKAEAAAKAKAEAEAKRQAEEAAKDPWERDPQDPEWLEEDDDPLVEALRAADGEAIVAARSFAGDLTLEIEREKIRQVAEALKNEHGYLLPVDICGAHYPDRDEGAFEVVYHLYSFEANRRIRLKVKADEDQEVPSVTPVWRGANWPEREVYDMYGVRFSDHPDMTRILLWEGFNGYPLRKDFPVEGIDTGTAIYPEYYEEEAGPIAGTGTGWKVPEPPEPEPPEPEESGEASKEEPG